MTTVAAAPTGRQPGGIDRGLLYGRAALVALAIGFAASVLGADGAAGLTGRLGGDFPAFYAAGTLVADGNWDGLYDPDVQAATQDALFAGNSGAYLYFAYPPPVAALYRPFAALDYRLAYVLHTMAMAALLMGALALARPMVPLLQRRFESAVTATLLFYPMLRAVTGGQNTALTLFLLVAAWRGIHDDRADLIGVTLALLLYKPQFALPLLGLMLWQRRARVIAVATGCTGALWAVSALAMGADWLPRWWSEASGFAELDAAVNGHNAVSLLGTAEALVGSGSTAARAVAAPLMLTVVLALLWLWQPGRPVDATVRSAVTTAAIVFLSPHAMFYDAGLLAFTGIVALDRLGERARPVVALVWVLAWTQLFAETVGFAPLFPLLLGGGAMVARQAWPAEVRARPRLG